MVSKSNLLIGEDPESQPKAGRQVQDDSGRRFAAIMQSDYFMNFFSILHDTSDMQNVLQAFLISAIPFYIGIFVLGAIIGSYINSWVWRVHNHQWRWGGRSKCVHCSCTLAWYENIPLASFVFLRGRCRTCKGFIPFDYFLVELIVPVLFLIVTHAHIVSTTISPWHYFRDIFFTVVLVVIFVYDYKYMEIHSGVVWGSTLVALAINHHLGLSTYSLALGVAVGCGFFLLQYLVSRGCWVGGGDVRLGFMMGSLLGFPTILIGLFFAYMFGMVVAIPLLVSRTKNMHSEIPFGTFLSLATFVCLLCGNQIIGWYQSLMR